MKNPLRSCIVASLAGCLALASSGAVHAEVDAARGFYLSAGYASAEVDGRFDGQSFVAGGGSLEILPEIGYGSGAKLGFGLQGSRFDFDMNFVRSASTGRWLGAPFETEFAALNFDGRYYWLQRVRPFILLGIGFNQLEVENGSTDGLSEADAKYKTAVSVRWGGGVQFVVRPRIQVQTEAVYRKMEFSNVDGIVSGSLEGSEVDGSGMTLSANVRFVFGK